MNWFKELAVGRSSDSESDDLDDMSEGNAMTLQERQAQPLILRRAA